MEVPLSDIFHLEIFRVGNEDFIKDIANPARGNATRYPGKKVYVSLSEEKLVQRKEPDVLASKS